MSSHDLMIFAGHSDDSDQTDAKSDQRLRWASAHNFVDFVLPCLIYSYFLVLRDCFILTSEREI